MEIETAFSIGVGKSNSIQLTPNFVVGLIFLFLGIYFRNVALRGWQEWRTAFQPIQPNLQASPAPIITASQGFNGLFISVIASILMIVFLLLAFDQFLTAGDFVLRRWDSILQEIGMVFRRLFSFLVRIVQAIS